MKQFTPATPTVMPLRRFVVQVTGEADPNSQQEIQKAIRRYHNRLANGSIPRSLFRKIGKELFIVLGAFEQWLKIPIRKDTREIHQACETKRPKLQKNMTNNNILSSEQYGATDYQERQDQ